MRLGICTAIALATALAGARAARADEPDADPLHQAAGEFDEGARQLKAHQYQEAAAHFEAAFAAAPSPRALRNAIRARVAADQPARASTLSALAKRLYPEDTETASLADEVLRSHKAELARVTVTCDKPCSLMIGKHAVPGGASDLHVVYFTPGQTKLRASFEGGAKQARTVHGSAGQDVPLDIRTGGGGASDAGTSTGASDSGTGDSGAEADASEPDAASESDARRGEHGDGAADAAGAEKPPEGEERPSNGQTSRPWYRSQGLFYTSLGATVVLTGVTVWSGVDTLHDPGRDAVRAACVGQGTDCPLYQQGVGKQVRTDALIGASAGLGLVTLVIGAALTDFGGSKAKAAPVALTADGVRWTF